MAVNALTAPIIKSLLPAKVLSLGYPDLIEHSPGLDLICVDQKAHKGNEIIADLNYPHDLGEFDLVLDLGTLEHCFNICQAFLNAINAVKIGGHIIHISPVSMINHGYFNVCPVFYKDFYDINGFAIERLVLYQDTLQWNQTILADLAPDDLATNDIVKSVSGHPWSIEGLTTMMVLAKRLDRVPVRFPIQEEFR